MNRELLQQAIDTIGYYAAVCGEDDQDTPAKQTIEALRQELEEPEQEPVAYMLTTRNFGLGGETWDTTEYRDYPWDYDCVPLYTKGATDV